ncbi:hypothetical protein SESBI_34871 [Sesbania bispinosa]|nr:hypothetical protein SESBI_34871 [Sesbania bispinosa]
MCHEGVPFGVHRRCHVFRGSPLVVHTAAAGHQGAVTREVHGGGGSSGEDGSIKQRCVCSPSQHPGSFRCRQHQAKYVWRSRTEQSSTKIGQ